MKKSFKQSNVLKYKEKYTHYQPQLNHQRKESSILIPLVEKEGNYYILYEVRSFQLNHQPGDVCFPGGRIEENESRKQAAVRETCEELLVNEEDIEIIAALDGESMSYHYDIWPFVGIIHNYQMTYSYDEVDHVFLVPVNWLLSNIPQRYSIKTVTIPDDNFPYELINKGKDYQWSTHERDILFYLFQDEVIWGMTAKLTSMFIKTLDNVL